MKYYIEAFKNYSNFGGRATRTEFWMYQLINSILISVFIAADWMLGTCFKYDMGYGVQVLPYGYIFAVYALATLLPTLAVAVRRLHDVGKSGWFVFLSLIPVVGSIWLLVLYCTGGNVGDNNYGPDPNLRVM